MGTLAEWLQQNAGLGEYASGSAAGMWDHVEHGRRVGELQRRDSMFKNMFTQLVGRAPDETELKTMFSGIAPNEALLTGDSGGQGKFRDITQQFIGDNFQKQAQDQVSQQLAAQQGEATRLADLFRTQGNQAINSTESSLMEYQSKLFERLRPNLITSLQSQGLLNTGGLNQAVAGAANDFALGSQEQLMNMRLQNEQQANAIAFAGASAPLEYQRGNLLNQVPQMQQNAQGALGNLFQQRLMDQQFGNQMALMNRQAQIQRDGRPSFLQTMGGTLAGNVLSTLVPGVSANLGNQMKQSGTGGAGAGLPMAGTTLPTGGLA